MEPFSEAWSPYLPIAFGVIYDKINEAYEIERRRTDLQGTLVSVERKCCCVCHDPRYDLCISFDSFIISVFIYIIGEKLSLR